MLPSPRPILSVRALAWKLGIPIERLREIAKRPHGHYSQFPVTKRDEFGNLRFVRTIRPPHPELKQIQRRIKDRVLAPVGLPAAAHGGVSGKSPGSNAATHLRQRCVVNLDVRSFFDSVHHSVVYQMLRKEMGYGRDVSRLITLLTTTKGSLPQGAPTSTAIANLVLAEAVDVPVARSAVSIEAKYTRYVDDIALSGVDPRPLISKVGKSLSRRGLKMHRNSKLKISPSHAAQEVTGLNVNSGRLSVPKSYRDKVRAAIHALGTADDKRLPRSVTSVRGKIDHVRQYNSGSARRLDRFLAATLAKRTL